MSIQYQQPYQIKVQLKGAWTAKPGSLGCRLRDVIRQYGGPRCIAWLVLCSQGMKYLCLSFSSLEERKETTRT